MTHAPTPSTSDTADRELTTTRLFDAPRELVFDVWTDPKHVDAWWGPTGFRNATHAIDVRTGGSWRFVMHGPDGTDWNNRITYLEVVRPERLVYLHDSDVDDDPRAFHVTVTFADDGGKTRLTIRSLFSSAAAFEEARKYGAVEGAQQTLARFAAHLDEQARQTAPR